VAWKRIGRYFWLMLLIYIIAFLPMMVIELAMIVPMQLFAMGKSGPLTPLVYMIPLEMLLFIASLVYGVIIAIRLSLAFPASLTENLTGVRRPPPQRPVDPGRRGTHLFGFTGDLCPPATRLKWWAL